MPKLVVDGAILACSMGTSPSKLSVQPTNETYGGWNLAATVRDMLPETNLAPFGMCQSPINPKVAAAPSAAAGVLTPQPCVPAAAGPWTPGSKTVAITGGGWRKYDLPPMIDLEHECQSGEDALALFPALIAMARAMRTNFAGVAPFLYMGPSYLGTMRTMAQKAYAKVAADAADAARAAHAPRPRSSFLSPTWSTSFLSGVWDNSVLMPDVVACRYWPAAYSPTHGPDDEPSSPTAEAGYKGPWFPKDPPWWMWQWGISDPKVTDGSDPQATPPPTTSRSVGVNTTLDQDVWRGSLDDLVPLALRTQWTPT
jgi:hypothetical protein